MKKLSLLLVAAAIAFVGCDNSTNGDGGVKAPSSYSSKAILEYFSGAWCGFCPDGKFMAEEIIQRVPAGSFDYVVYHLGDQMDILDDDDIDDKFANGYPTGMINRIDGEAGSRYAGSLSTYDQYNTEKNNGWLIKTKAVQAETAKCGLAVDASDKQGNTLNVKVTLGIGGADMPEGNYYISCLMYEDEMVGTGTGWDQVNYFSKFGSAVFGASHPYYDLADPILGYVHTNVVRAVLHNNPLGDGIDAASLAAGAVTDFEYSVDLTPFDSDQNIVAWIHEFTDGAIESSSYIYNAQFVKVGEAQDFD